MMANFRYRAIAHDGTIVEGELEAADKEAAIRRIQSDGQMPINAEPNDRAAVGMVNLRGRQWTRRLRHEDITTVTRELATLLGAGITLDSSIRIIRRHATSERLHSVLESVQDSVRSGRSLSRALKDHPKAFDRLYVGLIRAGEASGSLDIVTERLASHREHEAAFRASLIASLTYPVILLAVAMLSLFALLSFVVPRFIPLFADAGAPLPFLTAVVFSTAEVFQGYWWAFLGLVAAAKVAMDRWLDRPANRRRLHARLLAAPVFGEPLLYAETARLTRTAATLLSSGLPLIDVLKLSREVVRNTRITEVVDHCIEIVRSGGRISHALRQEPVLPDLAIELITVGEESGNLETMLEKCAEALEGRSQQKLKRLVTLLEPILILGLGGAIGLVIVAILLAMLGLNDLIA